MSIKNCPQPDAPEPDTVVDATLKDLRRLLEHHKTFQARVATLRAKVEALPADSDRPGFVWRKTVLAEIDKLGGEV